MATEAEHFLVGCKSRSLAAPPPPADARATAEEEDGVEGLVCDCFETTRAFFIKLAMNYTCDVFFRTEGVHR